MSTQPIRRRWRLPTTIRSESFLVGIPVCFMLLGAATLYLAAPVPSLTVKHLIALVLGWMGAWGATYVLLRRKLPGADPFIIPLVSMLTGWGLLLLARMAPSFLLRQILWLGVSCCVLCVVALIPTLPRLLRRYRYTLLAAGLLLLAATFFFGVNPSGYGQELWLGAFGVYYQPSELLKLLLVIYLASYLSERRDLVQRQGGKALWMAVFGPMATMVGLALLLLGWQQDLGAALLFYLTFVAMLYLAWGKGWHVAVSLLLFVPIALAGYWLSDRVALRVSIWLDPWRPEQADRAFQILQSLYAFASGGLVGQGLGQGLPTLIPAVHTDFVYAALVEEFGMIGGVAVLLMFALLIYRGILLAQRASGAGGSPFESLLAGGIAALFAIQVWVIMGGNAKLIPITGVTLPFLSYGGSSLLTAFIAIGILLNISAPHREPITLTLTLAPTSVPLCRTAGRLGKALLFFLMSIALVTGVWTVLRADELRDSFTNPRRILAESRIQRGRILDRDGVALADISVDDAGYVTRVYPAVEAAPVIGYNTLQYGVSGIEAACDPRLRGDIGRTPWQDFQMGLLHQSPVGRDVQLTLDVRLQQTAQHLLEGYQGAAVLVDTRTGEILALASSPTYNPATVETDWADLYAAPDAPLLNRATQSLAQPGSVLETVVLAAALREGELPELTFPLSGYVQVNGESLTCALTPLAATWQSVLKAGCPAPIAALGEQLGMSRLAENFTAWGLTDAPALEIPTVAAPWEAASADVIREAVGQGDLLVTPLHMVNVAAIVGNAGVHTPLHLLANPLSGCESPDTSTTTVTTPDIAAQILDLWPRYGSVVGHLGEALAGPDRTQTWFIGLNSPQVPRYAVAVLIENVPDRQIPAQIGEELLGQAVNP